MGVAEFGFTQNLVDNGDFETLAYCDTSLVPQEVLISAANGWKSISGATPNHLNACHTTGGGFWAVPLNSQGFQIPLSGNSYAGIISAQDTSDGIGGSYREYFQSALMFPLTAGIEYSIGFYCSLAESSEIAANNIGMFLSDTAISTLGTVPILVAPQLQSDSIISDTAFWIQVHTRFVADGTEKFVTIGNFNTMKDTDYEIIKPISFFADAYYYIDDVYIIDSTDHVGLSPMESFNSMTIYPNPGVDLLHINVDEIYTLSCKIYNIQGQCLLSKVLSGNQAPSMNIKSLLPGMYFLQVQTVRGNKGFKFTKT